MNSMDVFLRRAIDALGQPKDDHLTVVFRGLTSDEKREIVNRLEAVHLRHGNGLAERKELDRIASELQDTCHAQAKRIAEQAALLRQALEAFDNPQGMPDLCKVMDAIRQHLEGDA